MLAPEPGASLQTGQNPCQGIEYGNNTPESCLGLLLGRRFSSKRDGWFMVGTVTLT